MTEYAIEYLRPDGWWEAGRGWDSRADAEGDGGDHNWEGTTWRVVEAPEKPREGISSCPEQHVDAACDCGWAPWPSNR